VAEVAPGWIEYLGPAALPGTLELMSEMKRIFRALSIIAFSVGLVVIGVGAFFLKRLDNQAFGDPAVFYGSVHRYGSIVSTGVRICLVGCAAFALATDHMKGFRAARNCALIGVATLVFGIFLFPVHNASGAVYIYLLVVTFGASLIFVLVASGRWIWSSTHRNH
jgi:hypothetical protein